MNSPLNGPMNGPLDGPLNSSQSDRNNLPQNNGLGLAIDVALQANPGVEVMVAADATTAPAQVVASSSDLFVSTGVDALGVPVRADGLASKLTNHAGASQAGGTLAGFKLAQIDGFCPFSSFAGYSVPSGDQIDLYLPKLTVFRGESLVDLTPNGSSIEIDTDGDGHFESGWHIYAGTTLVCDDLMTNLIFLGKPWSGTWRGTPATHRLRPYEEPDLSYLCVKTSDTVSSNNPDTSSKWFCFRGVAGEGVLGFAYHSAPSTDHPSRQSPGARAFFAQQLEWHGNIWNKYFMYESGLAPIVTRIPSFALTSESTSASPFWWNINPNDNDGTDTGRIEQAKKFLAAVAVKTATNRKGVTISPYTINGSGVRGELSRCEDVTTAPGKPAGFAATPCEQFGPCTTRQTGSSRDCAWASDEVYSCTPDSPVSVGMGANALRCSRPLGLGADDTVLRVCDGIGGCEHAAASNLGEGSHDCGSTKPSVSFTCPSSGTFSVMKATGDSDRMRGVPWDAVGGGVPGLVGVSLGARSAAASPAEIPNVGTACGGAADTGPIVGEARDCGWTNHASYLCKPGASVTYGVYDSACNTIGRVNSGDAMIRICDGRNACTWGSTKRLGHDDNSCGTSDPSVTFTCGLSGEFTVMTAPYESGAPLDIFDLEPEVTKDNGVRPSESFDISRSVDVASTGDLQNDVLIHVAVPEDIALETDPHPRACDWRSNWGIGTVRTTTSGPATSGTCSAHDVEAFGFRVAANFDASSTWSRCPSFDPLPETSCGPQDSRDTFVTLKADPTRFAYLVPVAGAKFEGFTGMRDTPLPTSLTGTQTATCGGVPCCVAQPGAVAKCKFTVRCNEGITFQASTGSTPSWDLGHVDASSGEVGWSFQSSKYTTTTVVANHDWAFTADLRPDVVGNYVCDQGEDSFNAPSDCPLSPSCNFDGQCDAAVGETADNCPADCRNPSLGDVTVAFNDYTEIPDVPPQATPPSTDQTAPCLSVHGSTGCGAGGSITALANSSGGASITFDASATDDVDGEVAVFCTPRSGATFPIGSSTAECFASDAAGNVASATLAITVVDTVIQHTGDLVVEATGPNGAAVSYVAAAATRTYVDSPTDVNVCTGEVPPRDGDGPPAAVSCTPASGSSFPVGTTQVTCTASGAVTNFHVTVTDTTPPTLTLADKSAGATGSQGANVSYVAAAFDLVDGAIAPTCAPASGSMFAIGTTTVQCSATDQHGNAASGAFHVTVVPNTPPTITVPGGTLLAEATGPSGAQVSYTASATDVEDGVVPVTCAPASGSVFSLGNTIVTCSASDQAGNTAIKTFAVLVRDTTPPAITVPANILAKATSVQGANVAFAASALDLVDGTRPVTCNPPSGTRFPLSTTTVTCSSTDAHGNHATKSFTINVTYGFGGFEQPINSDGSSIFHLGSIVPVRFGLIGPSANIANAFATITLVKISNTVTGTVQEPFVLLVPDFGNTFNYRPLAHDYAFNLLTLNRTKGTFRITVDLGDGTTHSVVFSLR